MRAGFKLPKAELEELPLTIEITMTVEEWRQLELSDAWPGPHVASAIATAMKGFMDLAGSRWEIDRPYGAAEKVEEKAPLLATQRGLAADFDRASVDAVTEYAKGVADALGARGGGTVKR